MEDHQNQIKFVSNFHSSGNSWIYPYNGRMKNDIETRNPGMLAVFQEIADDAKFPEGNKHSGNSVDTFGEQIGGDMDDWVLSTFNIPSVTNELGTEDQYTDAWTVQSVDTGYQLVNENLPWLEHTYHKIGPQLKVNGGSFKSLAQKSDAPKDEKLVGIAGKDATPEKEEPNLM